MAHATGEQNLNHLMDCLACNRCSINGMCYLGNNKKQLDIFEHKLLKSIFKFYWSTVDLQCCVCSGVELSDPVT